MCEQASPNEIRKRLVEIDDELRTSPANEFATRHLLNMEADSLRRRLKDLTRDSDRALLAEWSSQAGHKGAHTSDHEVAQGSARIVSPMEGGGP
ncbi:MAG: hypothetical protein ACRBK7_13260 [Acidimicrobiales bacterium]